MSKNNILKRSLTGVICFILLITSFSGCVSEKEVSEKIEIPKMEAEEPDVYGFDFLGGTDVMPISGFYGPRLTHFSFDGQSMPNYVSDEFMATLAEMGINHIGQSYTYQGETPGAVAELLRLGEKYNIAICVNDERLTSKLGEETLSVTEIDELLMEYRDFPAFAGVYVVDEPHNDNWYDGQNKYMSEYRQLYANLKELDVFSYGNLFPLTSVSGSENYEKYLKEWVENCDVYYLSWDHYVWDRPVGREDYFANLSLGRKYAEMAEIPFWSYIEAGGNHVDTAEDTEEYYPLEGEFYWNVHTSLAYGAKGIQYFPIIQPSWYANAISQPYDFERNGLLGVMGNKNRWYYYAQNVNKQIAAVDEVLMNSVNKGVIATGERAKKETEVSEHIMKTDAWRELIGIEGETLIGCFNYKGKSAYYVVNYEHEYAQNITLNFADNYDMTVTQDAEKSYVNTKSLELTLKAGEGVLVVIES